MAVSLESGISIEIHFIIRRKRLTLSESARQRLRRSPSLASLFVFMPPHKSPCLFHSISWRKNHPRCVMIYPFLFVKSESFILQVAIIINMSNFKHIYRYF